MEPTGLKVPYICLNGAEVRDESFDIMHTSSLNHEMIEQITHVLNRENIYYQVYTNFGIYTEDPQRDLDIYIDIAEHAGQKADVEKIKKHIQHRIDQGTLKVVSNYDQIAETPGEIVMKLLAFDGDVEKVDRVSKELAEHPNLAISSSARGNIEITNAYAQKGIALEEIASQLGIKMENVMAIGDNMNDVSMLSRAGYPVAMENAIPEVKEYAKYVTDTNQNSGVGKAINKMLEEQSK